ncbi:MAG: hypothetical protein M0026_06725 [Nocardiopsaceae bacterium]|nr:hypothetical protein [Nocardiopsaceae bacterium]
MRSASSKVGWIVAIIAVIIGAGVLFSGSSCGDYDRVQVSSYDSSFDPDDWELTDSGIRYTGEDRSFDDRAPAGADKGADGNYYRYDPGDGDYEKNGDHYEYVGCSDGSSGSGGWIFTGGGSSYRGGGSGFGK